MKDLWRPLLSLAGLAVGAWLYSAVGRAGEPTASWLIGAMFAVLGALAYVYAQGERWIQVLGGALLLYGVLRATVLH